MYPVMIGYQYGIISDELVPIFTGKASHYCIYCKLLSLILCTFFSLLGWSGTETRGYSAMDIRWTYSLPFHIGLAVINNMA